MNNLRILITYYKNIFHAQIFKKLSHLKNEKCIFFRTDQLQENVAMNS